jgi:hypothetical protein
MRLITDFVNREPGRTDVIMAKKREEPAGPWRETDIWVDLAEGWGTGAADGWLGE